MSKMPGLPLTQFSERALSLRPKVGALSTTRRSGTKPTTLYYPHHIGRKGGRSDGQSRAREREIGREGERPPEERERENDLDVLSLLQRGTLMWSFQSSELAFTFFLSTLNWL